MTDGAITMYRIAIIVMATRSSINVNPEFL
jgi:hypothetical protein